MRERWGERDIYR